MLLSDLSHNNVSNELNSGVLNAYENIDLYGRTLSDYSICEECSMHI